MGKMKEIFMKQNYPEIDQEREYLIDDLIAQERSYNDFLKFKQEQNTKSQIYSNNHTKINIGDVRTTEIDTENQGNNRETHVYGHGF